ncbi:MAG TPA: FAD-dependent monooxygenase [Thermoleophilaceae bacterium]|jgi:2-polyprenyl-6-methoxyphenol hydroxylase-like FAD-dependent oxidoreductase
MPRSCETSVLIVGGGPTGLSASMLLGRLGVESLLLERRATTSDHPKATIVNTRTMELFHVWDIEDEVRDAGLPVEHGAEIAWVTRVAGHEIGTLSLTDDAERLMDLMSKSPTVPGVCPQHRIEPILRRAAEAQAPSTLLFGTELVAIEQDREGVTATAVRETGEELVVRARYLIGADGPQGPTRAAVGIGMDGEAGLADVVNVHFRADLSPWHGEDARVLTWIVNKDLRGVVHALDGGDRWLLNTLTYAEEEGNRGFDLGRADELVRLALGAPDCDAEVLSVKPWTMNALVAERFRAGAAFLAGDAAHQIPPTGGFGMNTGIQDAHNLTWKLAAVLQGWAGPALLDSYEAERMPVARANTAQSVANAEMMRDHIADLSDAELRALEAPGEEGARARRRVADGIPAHRAHFDYPGLDLGFTYDSDAVVPDGTPAPEVADPVRDYEPTGRPGGRAPHVWLRRGDAEVSSQELFGQAVVLLTDPDGEEWSAAARSLARRTGIPVRVHQLGPGTDLEDLHGEVPGRYGLGTGGAVLVRPDGHVGWRSAEMVDDPASELEDALRRLLGHGGGESNRGGLRAEHAGTT